MQIIPILGGLACFRVGNAPTRRCTWAEVFTLAECAHISADRNTIRIQGQTLKLLS
ncbi:hypothetical protein [Chloroflexus sp.]|uniref:hypothetical protein n=1 Tax=Chloroflexus sp. TaxID=1904827 RepID=UPI002ACE9DB1|nr:hypothetical protein [Chloroflexus sp.]